MRRPDLKKILLLALLAALAGAFFAFGLGDAFSLASIKANQTRFALFYAENPALTLGGFFLLYVAVTALNLPGATILGLAGGALFGFWAGVAVISFASSIGATLACALSRYLFRAAVLRRFGDRLAGINEGVAREGAYYLFTMRLIPAIPFFVINMVMGLTSMRLFTFYWVSQIGMLPGTAVYVNAGRELGSIDSLSGVLSPGLLLSFILLGVFPLIVKKALALFKHRPGGPA